MTLCDEHERMHTTQPQAAGLHHMLAGATCHNLQLHTCCAPCCSTPCVLHGMHRSVARTDESILTAFFRHVVARIAVAIEEVGV